MHMTLKQLIRTVGNNSALAKRAGVTRATLVAIANGRSDPKWATVQRIVRAAGGTVTIEGDKQ